MIIESVRYTPIEFADEMEAIVKRCGGDPEEVHYRMDELILELLTSLGYGKGVEVFKFQEIWYA